MIWTLQACTSYQALLVFFWYYFKYIVSPPPKVIIIATDKIATASISLQLVIFVMTILSSLSFHFTKNLETGRSPNFPLSVAIVETIFYCTN